MGSFHAKNSCNAREYEYWLPTYALMSPSPPKPMKPSRELPTDIRIASPDNDRSEVAGYIEPSSREEFTHKNNNYRIDLRRYEKFKQAMEMFKGTHNFHNYTIARAYKDPSAHRHMMNIHVNEPSLFHGIEWMSVKLRGQSFMLHQIRKMICMNLSLLDCSFFKKKRKKLFIKKN